MPGPQSARAALDFPTVAKLQPSPKSSAFPAQNHSEVHECDEVELKPTSPNHIILVSVRVSCTCVSYRRSIAAPPSIVYPDRTAPATPDPSSSLHTQALGDFPTQQPPIMDQAKLAKMQQSVRIGELNPPDQIPLQIIICDSGEGWLTSPSALRVSIALRLLPRLPSTVPLYIGAIHTTSMVWLGYTTDIC